MATNRLRLNARSTAARLAAAAVLSVVGGVKATIATAAVDDTACRAATASTVDTASYGWPLRPFNVQHPVRGFFGDPRISRGKDGSVIHSFHFGIDIAGADGAPVYATLTGRVRGGNEHRERVAIAGPQGVVFAYWHVVPAVHGGDHVVAYCTVIGHIAPTWGHVHFAEFHTGVPLNPLRPGALGPYVDTTTPLITGLGVPRAGLAVAPHGRLSGLCALVVEVHDNPQVAVPTPWNDLTAAPALVRWRIDSGRWTTALDFRRVVPKPDGYDQIYAYHTHQNRPNRRGHYLIYLARSWDARSVPAGRHTLQVDATDLRGNRATASIEITVTG
jgi:hypothetical protein